MNSGQWINTKNKLPEINKPVLIYDGEGIAVARIDKNGYWWINESYGFNEDGQILGVEYWMVLPGKPLKNQEELTKR